MICKKCEFNNSDDELNCLICGEKLSNEIILSNNESSENSNITCNKNFKNDSNYFVKNKKKLLFISLSLFMLIILVTSSLIYIHEFSLKQEGKINQNKLLLSNLENENIKLEILKNEWDAKLNIVQENSKSAMEKLQVERMKYEKIQNTTYRLNQLNILRENILNELKIKNAELWFEYEFTNDNSDYYTLFSFKEFKKNIPLTKFSAITYKYIDNGWKLVSNQQQIDKPNNFMFCSSELKKPSQLRISNHTLVILVDAGDCSGSGGGTDSVILYEFNNFNWHSIGNILINFYEFGSFLSEGVLSIIPSNKKYPDLLLTISREEYGENITDPVKSESPEYEVYFFNGKEYSKLEVSASKIQSILREAAKKAGNDTAAETDSLVAKNESNAKKVEAEKLASEKAQAAKIEAVAKQAAEKAAKNAAEKAEAGMLAAEKARADVLAKQAAERAAADRVREAAAK
jgi:hypothetical protein